MIYYEIIKSINFIFSDFCRCLSEALSFVWCHSDSIRNLVTSAGIIAAGCWFYQKRQQLPRANLTHKIIHKELDQDTLLVHVTVTIQNIGNVLIQIDHARIEIDRITLLTNQVYEAIQEYEDIQTIEETNESNKLSIKFPQLFFRKINFKKEETILVEPGETENIGFDFIFKQENSSEKLQTIRIYCYIRNMISHHRSLGWSFEDFYDFNNPT